MKSKGKEIDEIFLYDLINSMEKLPFEKNMTYEEKKEAISSYVTDPYVIQVSRRTDLPIMEYKIINYALRFQLKKVIWQFCCMKKWLLELLQSLQKGKGDQLCKLFSFWDKFLKRWRRSFILNYVGHMQGAENVFEFVMFEKKPDFFEHSTLKNCKVHILPFRIKTSTFVLSEM